MSVGAITITLYVAASLESMFYMPGKIADIEYMNKRQTNDIQNLQKRVDALERPNISVPPTVTIPTTFQLIP